MRMPRWSVHLIATLLVGCGTAPAFAQYQPRGAGSAAVENYKVEFGAFFWSPTPEVFVNVEFSDVPGTTIGLVDDLGVEERRLPDFRFVFHPFRKHKFRVSYMPITYETDTVVERTFIFNGTTYNIGVPVTSDFEWHTWRFGYEYDFISRAGGYVGLIVEAKYTDVRLDLAALGFSESASARAPIPAIGGTFRVYPAPFLAISGEFTGITLPSSLSDTDEGGDYVDWDISTTVNFSPNVGAQLGYRKVDMNYHFDEDLGKFVVDGVYFGGVVRF
jgi:hypothetical protein